MRFKNIKKVIAFLLMLTLLFSTNISVTAATLDSNVPKNDIYSFIEEDFGDLFDIVINNPTDYGIQDCIDDFSVEDFHILNPVEFNKVGNQLTKNSSEKIYHFPVMIKDKISLIYDVIESNNGYTSTLGSDFSPLMNLLVHSNEKYADFYQDNYNLYALAANNIYQQKGNVISVCDMNYNNFLKKTKNQSNDVKSYSFEYNKKYTELAIKSVKEQSKNTVTYSTAVTGTKNLSNYPKVNQSIGSKEYGMCWAATVASMVRFEKPKTYPTLTAQNVCDYMKIGYDDGGTNGEAKKALEHYLGSPYVPTEKSVLSTNDIYTVINNLDPAYMQCKSKTGFLKYNYHAVALTGYSFTSEKTTIRIMDPAYECFKTCTYKDGDWTFAFGDLSYTWIKTIRLLYSK